MSRPEPPPPPKNAPVKKTINKKPLKDGEKRLRALNKLLRDIEVLQEKEAAGETLDEQQETKLGRLDEVLAEMEELMGGG